jgi:4a-hydroxytetrahydrobiopterin dehydratase
VRVEIRENERALREPLLSEELGRLEGWAQDGSAITKTYTLKGFKRAMAFADRIAEAATSADHHPDIHIERYKHVRIVLTTHVVHAISQADIDLAAEIDRIHQALA